MIVMGSAKGAPGVSTSALALAAGWPGELRPVVWEADAAGGDLLHRFPVRAEPGLVSLAGDISPQGLGPEVVVRHTQQLPGGVPVIVGPSAPGAASAAMAALAPHWKQGRSGAAPWIVDVGRIDVPLERELAVLRAADATVLVSEGSMGSLTHTSVIADLLRIETAAPVLLVVVGPCRFTDAEILEALPVVACVRLPHDPVGADLLAGMSTPGAPWWRRQVRYPLLAHSVQLAHALETYLPQFNEPTPLSEDVAADSELAMEQPSLTAYVTQAGRP